MFKEYLGKIFSTKKSVESGEYEISFADPAERFSAFIIDSIITITITFFVLYPIISKEINRALNSFVSNEVSIEVGEQNNNNEKSNEKNVLVDGEDSKNKNNTVNKVDNYEIDVKEVDENNNINLLVGSTDNQKIEVKKLDRKPTEEERQEIIKKILLKNKMFIYLVFVIPVLYHVIFLLSKKHATIGQQILGLKIIRRNGDNIGFFISLDRVLLFTFSKNILIAPFSIVLPILITKEKTTIYDLFSGTRVIKVKNKIIEENESNNNNIG